MDPHKDGVNHPQYWRNGSTKDSGPSWKKLRSELCRDGRIIWRIFGGEDPGLGRGQVFREK